MVSVADPGVNGTMIRIGFDGNTCAAAVSGASAKNCGKD
jgi:hypothetical protein